MGYGIPTAWRFGYNKYYTDISSYGRANYWTASPGGGYNGGRPYVVGIRNGYKGLLEEDMTDFTRSDVSDILDRGGTKLGSARLPEFKDEFFNYAGGYNKFTIDKAIERIEKEDREEMNKQIIYDLQNEDELRF